MRLVLLLLGSLGTGVADHPADNRAFIWGGLKAVVGEFPYIVSIESVDDKSCTGAILAEYWVLTAAYCCISANLSRDIAPAMKIYTGVVVVPKRVRSMQVRYVDSIHINENTQQCENHSALDDPQIALLKVSEPFYFNKAVSVVRIAAEPVPETLLCVLVGFADLKYPSSKKGLRWKQLRIWDSNKCDSIFGLTLSKKELCSSNEDGRLSCRQDIGAPVVCHGTAVGVATMRVYQDAYSRDFTFGCEARYNMNVYSFTGAYSHWIRTFIPYLPRPVLLQEDENPFHAIGREDIELSVIDEETDSRAWRVLNQHILFALLSIAVYTLPTC